VVTTIYEYVVSIGGVLSGEHGIGLLQKEFMSIQHTASHLKTLQKIKEAMDPGGIMNPGKIL
jgi:glycolate oxidase